MNRSKMLRQGLFATAIAAVMGLGAVQAFASPRVDGGSARACNGEAELRCMEQCWKRGADGGSCGAGGVCRCWYN